MQKIEIIKYIKENKQNQIKMKRTPQMMKAIRAMFPKANVAHKGDGVFGMRLNWRAATTVWLRNTTSSSKRKVIALTYQQLSYGLTLKLFDVPLKNVDVLRRRVMGQPSATFQKLCSGVEELIIVCDRCSMDTHTLTTVERNYTFCCEEGASKAIESINEHIEKTFKRTKHVNSCA